MSVPQPDDLLVPTVQGGRAVGQPYRSGPMLYPAFFGGPLALLPFARRSAQQLGLPERDVRRVTLTCLAALAAAAVVIVLLERRGVTGRPAQLALQGGGVVAHVVVARLLRGPERRHELRSGTFARIGFWRGLGACVVLGLAQGFLVLALLGLLG